MNRRGIFNKLQNPIVMGILNATPDSFYNKGSHSSVNELQLQAERMLIDGSTILDIGGTKCRNNFRRRRNKPYITFDQATC